LRDPDTPSKIEKNLGDLIEDFDSPAGLRAGILDDKFQEPIPIEGIPNALK